MSDQHHTTEHEADSAPQGVDVEQTVDNVDDTCVVIGVDSDDIDALNVSVRQTVRNVSGGSTVIGYQRRRS